ncbi:MAG: hypothetical protein KA354_18610 [Phycisphaerae bacterium]|nr:hypothetical protein [Phycisphaerae bacterium]
MLSLGLGLGLAGGCRCSQPAAEVPKPFEVNAKDGPVAMTVRAAKEQILVAEKLGLTIEVIAPDDVDIEMPRFEERIGEFRIRRHRDEPAIPTDRGRRWRQEYELDQLIAGSYEIPSIAVKYVDRRSAKPTGASPSDASPTQHSVLGTQPLAPSTQHSAFDTHDSSLTAHYFSSTPFSIKVVSAIEGEIDLEKFEDIRGTVELPAARSRAWLFWTAGAATAVLALAGLWVYLRCRSARLRFARPIPPHVWAREELRRLREDNLVERGLVHELYSRMTGIVRLYIERRFRIMAAEQTTEEFLAAAKSHPALVQEYRDSLARFLQAGDMVKFARYTPEPCEIDQAFGAAETFVDRTAALIAPAASTAERVRAMEPEVGP